MIRTNKYRTNVVLVCLLVAAIVIGFFSAVVYFYPPFFYLLIPIVVAAFIPGRILTYYWGLYYQGQKQMKKGKPLEAIVFFEKFLKLLEQRPKLRRFMWLSGNVLTRNIEVLTLCNMATCYIQLDDEENAGEMARKALELDPESPLPHFKLAFVHHMEGDNEQALASLAKAEALGFYKRRVRNLEGGIRHAMEQRKKEQRKDAKQAIDHEQEQGSES